ncbi:MAG: helix-turn-helix transcriptional regulator [Acidimicrobiales bacterium]|nr:helix-turn-helix transcriptional regulator [Acidimicrobiales bacterium]
MREEPFGGGTVDLVVMSVVRAQERTYGYAVGRALAEAGVVGLGEAAVYACLRRLEGRGLVASSAELADNGRARRYYRLTDAGVAHLGQEQRAWRAHIDAVASVVEAGRVG